MKGFVFRLVPPRPDFPATMSDGERAVMLEHMGYWSKLVDQGSALVFGPVDDPAGVYGIGIVLADDLSSAEALRDGDPAMRSPYGFTTAITPMSAVVAAQGRFA